MRSMMSAAIAAFAANWRGNMTSATSIPNIEVVDVDLAGDRRLMLRHAVVKGARLNEADARRVLQHLADLWSYDVSLVEVDATDNVLKEYIVNPRGHRGRGVRDRQAIRHGSRPFARWLRSSRAGLSSASCD